MIKRQFRKLDVDGVKAINLDGRNFLQIGPDVLQQLAEQAFYELSYFLRADHLDELAAVIDDKTASQNERFVCSSLLKNAMISAEGRLPLCQDTGTATVFAWRGERVLTGTEDRHEIEKGIARTWGRYCLRNSQIAATDMFSEANTDSNLPAQIDIEYAPGNEYKLLFMAKGGGSSNKTVLHQGSKALLNEDALTDFLRRKISEIGVAACPPYTLVVVVGGTSPENSLKTLKLATAGWLDELPVQGDGSGRPFRDRKWEEKVLEIAAKTGWGAQFGGKYMAINARVIRLPRHAGSCPVSIGVSCSAHRNMLGKINSEGVWLEELDHNPARLAEKCLTKQQRVPELNLDRPMPDILKKLAENKAGDMLLLNGTMVVARDMAHARIRSQVKEGKEVPEYFKKHPVYYAGPARTPPGYAIGSFGPTTAQRMDQYIDFFMSKKASLITLAKGNRSQEVIDACRKYGGFYLGTIGGAAALIAKEHILSSEVIDFDDLGMEAVHRIVVKDLPVFIIYDNKGRKLYD
jgi:fumarate hydratase class I